MRNKISTLDAVKAKDESIDKLTSMIHEMQAKTTESNNKLSELSNGERCHLRQSLSTLEDRLGKVLTASCMTSSLLAASQAENSNLQQTVEEYKQTAGIVAVTF
eukprot:616565-Hanusia_phi.AAC.4